MREGGQFIVRMAGRELSRQSWRLLLITFCLAVGFAAFFATYGFSGRVQGAIRGESRALLGGDLSLSARGPLSAEARSAAKTLPQGEATVELLDFPTMASVGIETEAQSKLVEVRAVEGPYPLVGRLDCLPPLAGSDLWGVLVDRGLAQAWGLEAAPGPALGPDGGTGLLKAKRALRLGDGIVPIQAIVQLDDSRQAEAFALGPRIYLSRTAAQGLGLVTGRSRLTERMLVRLRPGASAGEAVEALRNSLPASARVRVRTHEEAASALARPIQNLNRFVQQLGLFTLLLASLGAWAILGAYLDGRHREAAILRCLGASPGTPAAIFGFVTAVILMGALLLGMGAGLGAAALLPSLLGELMPAALRQGGAVWPPALETLLAALFLATVLLPSLARLSEASPLSLLRDQAIGERRALTRLCALGASLLALALILRNAPSLRVGLVTALAMGTLFLLLLGVSRLLLRIYRKGAERLRLSLKLALGQLGARPALGALMMSVIALAVFLVLATQFVKDDLVAPLAAQRGEGQRPNLFFIDVQPDQIDPLKALLKAKTGREAMASPMVRARLLSIGGKAVEEEDRGTGESHDQGQHMRTREQNLTWRASLSDSERLVAGRFWEKEGPATPEISLEEGFARSIGAKLGDELTFDIQGQSLTGRVTSLRKVRWQSFQPNFFIVMHPSLLEGAPAVWITAAELDDAKARAALQSEAVSRWPNLSAIDVGEVVARIGRVLDLVALVTRTLAGLMLASALLVLAASLLAGRLGRQRDLALLRTLGASHGTLLRSLAWEFLLLGGSASLGASALAWVLARAYSTRVLDIEANPSPLLGLALLALVALLTALTGLASSAHALQAKPMEVLRGE